MEAKYFIKKIKELGIKTFTGVPDSLLKHLCYEIEVDKEIKAITAANEGSAIGIAAGVYLATKKPACVYLQNSGLGNTVNPLLSLMSEEVYNIPLLMVVGWRGEPGVKDEPQHTLQGKLTKATLEMMGLHIFEITKEITNLELDNHFLEVANLLEKGKRVVFLVRKGVLTASEALKPKTNNLFNREEAIKTIVSNLNEEDLVISTTGKISRELYELTQDKNISPFLTVGSMGHASMIALGVALNQPNKKVYCLDGDGATIMHMGGLATIGDLAPDNFYHILLNNSSHESVGNMPTTSASADFIKIASAAGYKKSITVKNAKELGSVLTETKNEEGPIYVEVVIGNTSREDLARPKETPEQNKQQFMKKMEGQ